MPALLGIEKSQLPVTFPLINDIRTARKYPLHFLGFHKEQKNDNSDSRQLVRHDHNELTKLTKIRVQVIKIRYVLVTHHKEKLSPKLAFSTISFCICDLLCECRSTP